MESKETQTTETQTIEAENKETQTTEAENNVPFVEKTLEPDYMNPKNQGKMSL